MRFPTTLAAGRFCGYCLYRYRLIPRGAVVMGRKPNPIPSYLPHKRAGGVVRARVCIRGKWIPLGVYGSPESRRKYRRLIAELEAQGGPPVTGAGITVGELVERFDAHARRHYRHPDGSPTSELRNVRDALRPVLDLYESVPAAEFGPLALKAVRAKLVADGICRTSVNARVGRVKRAFKWAVSEELIPETTHRALASVAGLRRNRTEAAEREPVGPVADAVVAATLPRLDATVAAMVRVQRLTGMRPGEVCALRGDEIDTTGPVWKLKPEAHKTAYAGKVRTLRFGPRAQAVLAPLLAACPPGEHLFSPKRQRAARAAARRAARKSKVPPSQVSRAKPPALLRRPPRDWYTPAGYGGRVAAAVKAENARRARQAGAGNYDPLPHWHPNQLRHTFGTAVRHRFGLEAAQVLLDHEQASTTEIYAERDAALADRVAAEVG